ncbi:MAG: RNA polymerase sigma factor [Sphingobacterium sp.]|uniref:RNA polymerase sigma factor n=1 Tax=Sphingobacterium sp. JB170 TaxID=1434842 RepID=UPI00097E93B3|nr:sigma-70 family RNA polymerase sigma factor [Sphingobacterium sp. JB170]SJN25779.1 RNA polymerase ECF-type sigma factor [Sphingobacterium sp. JB170]
MRISDRSGKLKDDNQLLKKFQKEGDLNVLGELFAKHSEMVYYVCLRYFNEVERSKDATMQIFELLITKINKQDIRDFPKWLYVVSKNHCLMALRATKNKMEMLTSDFVEFSALTHPEDTNEEREEVLTLLEDCISKLPEKQKVSINLFFLKQKCYKEVTEITGYNLKEVKSFIQNGKRNLKICIDRNGKSTL